MSRDDVISDQSKQNVTKGNEYTPITLQYILQNIRTSHVLAYVISIM